MRRLELPWRDPWPLAWGLAERFGREGLVWLDGDGSDLGRWSVLGVAPRERVVCHDQDPFGALAGMVAGGGHWMGWLAYGAGAWVEPGAHWRQSDMAVLWAARHDPVLRLDQQEQRLWLEGSDSALFGELAAVIEALPHQVPPEAAAIPVGAWHWHTSAARFAEQVGQVRELIARGDLFQANLSACCEQDLAAAADPLALYGRLRRHCPAPFSGLAIAGASAASVGGSARAGDCSSLEAVLSASPERFLQVSASGAVETRPIKGTRPRSSDPLADADAAADLVTNPKDRAENVMIVDLMRNDLGRVCQPGSIRVDQLVGLESYRQVHHLTSVVRGQLRPGLGLVDLLRASWPGGSITGAPKVRACQRLSELEPVPRGPYCGSLFRLGADGSFDSNILIRSVMVKGQRLRVHAGCGIVADSDPAGEAEELGWKLQPLLEALA